MKDFEFEDLPSVETLFSLPEDYIRRALRYPQAQQIARLALNRSYRYEKDAVAAVKKYFDTPEAEPTPPPTCNCPPARDLRWRNFPVTWSYSAFRQVIPAAHLIRQNWEEIRAVCGLTVKETAEADCNICITNAPLDGRGGTLGIAYMPASGTRMSSCGRQCGNIIIDNAEFFTEGYLKTVLMHEMLHALGIPHLDDRSSIMYPQYLGVRGLGDLDILELQKRYPNLELA